jgi:hypothetical protein
MSKPLTDSINALTRYANSVTGASDQTLSEAVATLASGYGGGGGRLPSSYQEVTFVGVWNNCYFDLGDISVNTGIHISYLISKRNHTNGPHIASTNNDLFVFCSRSASTLLKLGGTEISPSKGNEQGYITEVNYNTNGDGQYSIEWDAGSATSTITKGTLTTGRLYMFAYGMGLTNTQWQFNGYVYEFELYDGGVLARKFIPCYRKSDNVIGFYDIINDTFITTIGSGTLTKGMNV